MKAPHDNNFWIENKELLLIEELNSIYKKDMTKGKSETSLIMWGVYYITHPSSKYFNLPNKKEVIAASLFKKEKFKWEKWENLITIFKELYLTDAERSLVLWNDTMRLRDRSIKEMYEEAINDKNTKMLIDLDKMLASTPRMFQDYQKIKSDFEAEKETKKGRKIQSLSEKGEM